MKKVLIIICIDSHFTELIRSAIMLKASGRYEPVILFSRRYRVINRDISQCIREQIDCVDLDGAKMTIMENPVTPDATSDPVKKHSNLKNGLKEILFSFGRRFPKPIKDLLAEAYTLFFLAFISIFGWLRYYQNQRLRINRTIERLEPDILIMAEDNMEYDMPIWIKAAHEQGIPSLIIPYTIANAKEPAEAFYDIPEYSLDSMPNRIFGFLCPKWVYVHRGKKMIRLTITRALAIEILRLSPDLPWIINSGQADAIAVENEAMRKYYLDAGIRPEKMVITGAIYDDVLAKNAARSKEIKYSIYKKLGFDSNKPMILCALPPDQIIGCTNNSEFLSYEDIVKFWINTLCSISNYNVVIKLHPRVFYDDMIYIEQWGLKISQEDTAVLVAACDIYISSVSATIRWAIACGKPVINYDVYRYRYDDYAQEKGVITIENKTDFIDVLNKLTHDDDYYKKITEFQVNAMKGWGNLDGRSSERIIKLLDDLLVCYNRM